MLILCPPLFQVKNMKTLAEALEVFTSEEVVSFKWDKEVNADTGQRNPSWLNVSMNHLRPSARSAQRRGRWSSLFSQFI